MRRLIAVAAVVLAAAGCAATAAPGPESSSRLAANPKPWHAAIPAANIKHVFVIVNENESYADSYVHNPNPYLGKRLQKQGTLLTHYYAIGHVSLDNYLAMMSGQAPNVDTGSDCQIYSNFNATTAPATLNAAGQAVGVGCVYPSNVLALPNQLQAAHISWGGYMDDMGKTPGREQARCGIPTTTAAGLDDTQKATPQDQYAARHNPFVYFHSLIDDGSCKRHVKPLSKLGTALHRDSTTPKFVFITPDLCNDGHDSPCKGKDAAGSSAGGLKGVDDFLKKWIPIIKASPAYRDNGIIIITSDESETSDTTSCCGEKPGPTDPEPGLTGPGGGRIGTLILGHCIKPGSTDARPYNHYSLLRSLEDIYGITSGGSDGKGHLGYAGQAGLRPFGKDVFKRC